MLLYPGIRYKNEINHVEEIYNGYYFNKPQTSSTNAVDYEQLDAKIQELLNRQATNMFSVIVNKIAEFEIKCGGITPSLGSEIDAVWETGEKAGYLDPNLYRADCYGNILYYYSYGQYTPMGWQIDHIQPKAKNGRDHINNLQTIQSRLNASLSDTLDKKTRYGITLEELIEKRQKLGLKIYYTD